MDYDAYLIDPIPFLFYSGTDVAVGATVDTPGYAIRDPGIAYAGTDVATGGVVDTPAYRIEDPGVRYAGSDVAAFNGVDTIAFEFGLLIQGHDPYGSLPATDSPAWLIGFNPDFHPPLIRDSSMVEILYPVVPVTEANKVLTRLDNEEIRVTLKGAALRTIQTDTIHFRVDTSYLPTFLADLDNNRLSEFRLNTPGYTPFGGTSQDNFVRVLTRSRPQREDRGLTQLVSVTFRFMAVV
jgi:hypothetical protein